MREAILMSNLLLFAATLCFSSCSLKCSPTGLVWKYLFSLFQRKKLNTVFLFPIPFYSAYQEKDERRADIKWVAKSNGSTQKRNWKREEALVSALQLLD